MFAKNIVLYIVILEASGTWNLLMHINQDLKYLRKHQK